MGNSMKRRGASLVTLLIAITLAACGGQERYAAPQPGNCAIIAGNGKKGTGYGVQDITYQGKSRSLKENELVFYVPCNSRNYIVATEGRVDRRGNPVGDTQTPIRVTTSDEKNFFVYLKVTWTLNQDKNVMVNDFFGFCQKYKCATEGASDGSDPNETGEGWTSFVAENFQDATSLTLRAVFRGHPSSEVLSAANWEKIGEEASKKFQPAFRRQSGISSDLICGSGDISRWDDPFKPGVGKFTCGDVRVDIDEVVPVAG